MRVNDPSTRSEATLPRVALGLPAWADGFVRRVVGIREMEERYARVRERIGTSGAARSSTVTATAFARAALEELSVRVHLPADRIAELQKIEGPMVFVANHPFGGLDALALLDLIASVRDDYRFLANELVGILPELEPILCPVDIAGDAPRSQANVIGMRKILRYLDTGGALGIFPAGEVAAYPSFSAGWSGRGILERAWHPHLGRIVRHARATVVPVYFEGQNSALFQYLGLAVRSARIALLAREILRPRAVVHLRIGDPIPYPELTDYTDSAALAAELRQRCLDL